MFGIESLPVVVPVVLGLTQMVKFLGLPSKYSALVSIIFGLFIAFLVPADAIRDTIFFGIVAGLSASGLWSGAKNAVETIKGS